MSQQIRFLFEPRGFEQGAHAVEKADEQGRKRCYLRGVSSGLQVDAHGERMTENAIKGFMKQANEGHILLYADRHGVSATDDIGLLTEAAILENGDWATEYRLYDELDGVDTASVERARKLWMQVKGLGPYGGRPLEKGFSVEGTVEDDDVVLDGRGRRALDEVLLDGVLVVPRPAYKPSVVQAVSKALGMAPPISLRNRIQELMRREEDSETLFRKRYQVDDALARVVQEIVTENVQDPNKMRDQLRVVFDEYGDITIDLIMGNTDTIIGDGTAVVRDEAKERVNLSKAIETSLEDLAVRLSGRC